MRQCATHAPSQRLAQPEHQPAPRRKEAFRAGCCAVTLYEPQARIDAGTDESLVQTRSCNSGSTRTLEIIQLGYFHGGSADLNGVINTMIKADFQDDWPDHPPCFSHKTSIGSLQWLRDKTSGMWLIAHAPRKAGSTARSGGRHPRVGHCCPDGHQPERAFDRGAHCGPFGD